MLLPLHQNLAGAGTTYFQTISATVTGAATITTRLGFSQTISANVTGMASIAELFIAGPGIIKVVALVYGVARGLVRGIVRSLFHRRDD